jgi:cold shock CspA family protein
MWRPDAKVRLQVIAIHSVERRRKPEVNAEVSRIFVTGTVEFYNHNKGYGFIKTSMLPEDIYLSAKTLEQHGLNELTAGDRVKVSIEPSRLGKGYMATSVEMTNDS